MHRTTFGALVLAFLVLTAASAPAFDLSGVTKALDTSAPEGTDALLKTQSELKSDLAGTLAGLLTSQSSMAGVLGDSGGAGRLVGMAKSLASGSVGDDLLESAMSMVSGYNEELSEGKDKLNALSDDGKSSIADSLLSYAKYGKQLGLLDDKFVEAASQAQSLLEKASAAQAASVMDQFSFLITAADEVPDLASSVYSTGKDLVGFCQSAGKNVSAAAKLLGM